MHQVKEVKEMKDWTKDIQSLREKIMIKGVELEEEKENLIKEIIGTFNDAIGDIHQSLIKLGFEDNPDHLSHEIFYPSQDKTKDLWVYARWKIYLGKTKKLILLVDLCGNGDENPLERIPDRIYLNMPRWKYRNFIWGISIENLYALFDSWLDVVNSKIKVKNLEELKIKLSLL